MQIWRSCGYVACEGVEGEGSIGDKAHYRARLKLMTFGPPGLRNLMLEAGWMDGYSIRSSGLRMNTFQSPSYARLVVSTQKLSAELLQNLVHTWGSHPSRCRLGYIPLVAWYRIGAVARPWKIGRTIFIPAELLSSDRASGPPWYLCQ